MSTPHVRSLEQAAQWYATLRNENASERDRQAWQAWRAQSPEHENAWQHIEAISRKFEPLRGNGSASPAAAVAGMEAARRIAAGRRRAFVSVLGLGMTAWLGWRFTPLPSLVLALQADHHTGAGERREIILADGTRVWLNTATSLNVDYRGDLRQLTLLDGEIFVETAPDAQHRPFYVQTGLGRMQALGTRFTVRMGERQARLDVFEGTVEIRLASGQTRRVPAGQAARFDAQAIVPPTDADHVREAWRQGRLPADDMPLGELLAELGRYRHGHISVAPEVADLKVMGVYPTDDPDRALDMLEQTLPIRVRRSLPWWTTVEGR